MNSAKFLMLMVLLVLCVCSPSFAELSVSEELPYPFQSVLVGTSVTKNFIVTNTGTEKTIGIQISPISPPFTHLRTLDTCTDTLELPPGASCSLVIKFAPAGAGAFSQTPVIGYRLGAVRTNTVLNLSGSGTSPALLTLSDGPTYNFPPTLVRRSSQHFFRLSNSGGVPATEVTFARSFSAYSSDNGGTCTERIAPGESCLVKITFSPSFAISFPSRLRIDYHDGLKNRITSGALSGIGVDAPYPPQIFDPEIWNYAYYISTYTDLSGFTMEMAKSHWINFGMREGRQGNVLYKATEYRAQYLDLTQYYGVSTNQDAIVHYVTLGRAQKRAGIFLLNPDVFDWKYYNSSNSLGLTTEVAAKSHWLSIGSSQCLRASIQFNALEYQAMYGYPVTDCIGPIVNFIRTGRAQGRLGRLTLPPHQFYHYVTELRTSPATVAPGDRREVFNGADGHAVRVVVKAPNNSIGEPLNVAPLAAEGSAYDYFKNAIKQARELNSSKLIFPTGDYHIEAPPNLAAEAGLVLLNNLADLEIDGQGSSLIFKDLRQGLQIVSSQRVLIKNFTIDWERRISSLGIIEARPNGGKQLRIDSNYPIDGDTERIESVSQFDGPNKKWKGGIYETYPAVQPTYEGNQIFYSSDFNGFALGTTVLVRHHVYGYNAIYVGGKTTEDISFENITIYGAPGMGFLFNRAKRGFRISGCTIARNPSEPLRLISTSADGSHFNRSGGDIILENNDFSSMGDDAINIHNSPWKVSAVSGSSAILAPPTGGSEAPNMGDRIGFFNQALGFLGTANVVSSSVLPGTVDVTVELDQEITAMEPGSFAANLSLMGGRLLIRDNDFHDSRGRGMLIQASNALIEQNDIWDITMAGVHLTSDANNWFEGTGANNIIFRSNTLTRTYSDSRPRGPNARFPGAFNVASDLPEGWALYPFHQNILIEGNTISETPGLALFLGSAKYVIVKNNTIENANLEPFNGTGVNTGNEAHGSIMVIRSSNVDFSGNVKSGSSKELYVGKEASFSVGAQLNY